MASQDQRFTLVHNGEIYNFKELQEMLPLPLGGWKSGTDTEVIIEAYRNWGPQCVNRFDGMFAFAIWDEKERTLFCARDRAGVKPFYYFQEGERFLFSSRPKALMNLHKDHSFQIDLQGLKFYLECGYFPAPHFMFQEIRKLPAGHTLTFKNGRSELRQYWSPHEIPTEEKWLERPEDDLVDELEELLLNSVRSRMVSDVPVGAFLSGGVDSSLVAAMMQKISGAPVKTFNIGFEETNYDESSFAAQVARSLKTDHQTEKLRVDDLLKLFPLFREEYDEPFFDYSAFPVMAVSRLAAQKVKVSLSGDGADELFGGYHYYLILQKLKQLEGLPSAVKRTLAAAARIYPHHKMKLLAGALEQERPMQTFAFMRSVSKDFDEVFDKSFFAGQKNIGDLFQEKARPHPNENPVAAALRADFLLTLPDDYLQKVDVGSMAFSIEARDPFLGKNLMEWAFRLPVEWKLRNGTSKYLLKKLALRHVPKNCVMRKKQGFSVPLEEWLRGPLKNWMLDRLGQEQKLLKFGLKPKAVMNRAEQHLSGTRNIHTLLWTILMLLEFEEHYGKS